ncbi:hypothetical protein QJQ45_019954 [Haematococcus lacustris]|nr:hypothetical protein QJQ45_019954 [Haematococcus lacustris]
MPPVKKATRASRANGAKAKVRHEPAKSMEQLTAAHATLTGAHAALTAELLSSQELYSQQRERHCSLLVSARLCEQQGELDMLQYSQHVDQLEELFLQQLQGTQAQLTNIAAALEAAHKDLAAARTELTHTKKQLTTTRSSSLRTHRPTHTPSSNYAVESSLQHTKHGNSAKQGLEATIGSIDNKLDPGALANIDLANSKARLPTLRKQKRDRETSSADDNREPKAARKAEEATCMVDGTTKMVPTHAPLQQLQQTFQQHARGADYNNTSAKEAARFTRSLSIQRALNRVAPLIPVVAQCVC